jgi:hypothetical protein
MAAIVASGAAIGSTAQEPAAPLSVDVGECIKLATPEERLACFEAQVEDARNPPTAAGAPAAAGNAAPANGRSLQSREDAEPQDIHAKVAELRETVPNAYLITLDNGQVWRQTVPKRYPLRPGDDVRIYYSKWRTFRLTNDKLRSYVQVERVR